MLVHQLQVVFVGSLVGGPFVAPRRRRHRRGPLVALFALLPLPVGGRPLAIHLFLRLLFASFRFAPLSVGVGESVSESRLRKTINPPPHRVSPRYHTSNVLQPTALRKATHRCLQTDKENRDKPDAFASWQKASTSSRHTTHVRLETHTHLGVRVYVRSQRLSTPSLSLHPKGNDSAPLLFLNRSCINKYIVRLCVHVYFKDSFQLFFLNLLWMGDGREWWEERRRIGVLQQEIFESLQTNLYNLILTTNAYST